MGKGPYYVFGIDPGLVHTGVVQLSFYPARRAFRLAHTVIVGNTGQADGVAKWVGPKAANKHVFIEGYKPRSHYDTDNRMVATVSEMHHAIPGSKVILNHGVKKVIRRATMEALNLWSFGTVTHHQDLRSAGYIALFGMVKNQELNELLFHLVDDLVDGRPWNVLS